MTEEVRCIDCSGIQYTATISPHFKIYLIGKYVVNTRMKTVG